ncbi:ABC transporter ATP-binding protein [Sedimentitalea sp. JM2-8]|uniref:ABC transporter ATP-binding protein n=1 Tax=Sedimentitalea xiamensis TaxID=3050037 RepID=A0ABT7FC61_9RHOB|nr:ABC transporter ATP-binding protein [Sedimentitalea xiamensis]MDK3072702.1 ABC transporter ATP-binding protein [Sedimentitalea xiamensis]
MLEARDLSIGYGKMPLGIGLSVTVRPGEILCLLGPNGCGKTTLFRTLLGLLPQLGGSVLLNGQPISAMTRARIAQAIAYVPQAHAPPFPFEALEVVLMGRTARLGAFAQPGKTDRAAARDALRRLGIQDLAHRDYSRLSGGQRQLVLIARALAQQAALIVMDEPTASLDFGNQAQVLAQIETLTRSATAEGHGVILSTHDPDQAFALNARVLLMHRGGVLADGPAADVLTEANLSTVYGLPVTVETTSSGRRICLPSLRQSAPTMTSEALTMA